MLVKERPHYLRILHGCSRLVRWSDTELCKVQHSQGGGHVPCMVVNAFDPSLRVGWQEILSWYLMELDRRSDESMAIVQHRLWIT